MVVRASGTSLEVNAPAKLNLHLEILARRNDGFHEIETLMVSVSIYDTLRFSPRGDNRIEISCRWAWGLGAQHGAALGDLPAGESNIVYRAVDQLRRAAGIEAGVTIEIVKRIPSQAGLGGASSDAAAALLAANELWQLNWSRQRLANLASRLGSDIPFFFGERAAICRGRGEQIESLPCCTPLNVVVVRPPEGLSTPAVYKACRVAEIPTSISSIASAVQTGTAEEVARQLMNRLQAPAEQISPAVAELRKVFARTDCLGHQMSGSGSSYFGICRNALHARRIATQLEAARVGLVAWGVTGRI